MPELVVRTSLKNLPFVLGYRISRGKLGSAFVCALVCTQRTHRSPVSAADTAFSTRRDDQDRKNERRVSDVGTVHTTYRLNRDEHIY